MEEVKEQEIVQLGMPGAWAVDYSEPSDHYSSKIGGRPDWPHTHDFLFPEPLRCAVCGNLSVLLAQVHAPLRLKRRANCGGGVLQQQCSERTLYVFGCCSRGCGSDPTCWRTFRVQKLDPVGPLDPDPTAGAAASDTSFVVCGNHAAEPISGAGEEDAANSSTDWWEDNDSWGVEDVAASEGSGAVYSAGTGAGTTMDMKELECALVEAGRMAAESGNTGEEISLAMSRENEADTSTILVEEAAGGNKASGSPRVDVKSQNLNLLSPILPCFYLYFQPEANTWRRGRKTTGTSSSSSSFSQGPASEKVAAALHPVKEEASENREEEWEGEEYEPDRALCAGKTYLRFKKYLDDHPELCLRYCVGGDPLWAIETEEEEDVKVREASLGKCKACGAVRMFEMQLMPPLLYFLQQALSIASEDVGRSFSLDEWDWFSLVVFTCAESCSQRAASSNSMKERGEDWSVVEEAIVLQQEGTRVQINI